MPLQATSGAASYDGFGGGAAAVPQYIEDIFSCTLFTGTGSNQTITNNIDLSTKGGLVWTKSRSNAQNNSLVDTVRGGDVTLVSETTNANDFGSGQGAQSFTSTGYVTGGFSARTYVSWTFRKQPKFFDVVTYTGTGSNTTIAHSLGSVPGSIIIKRTDTTAAWAVYHRSLANTQYLVLNTTAAAATGATWWNSTTPTSAVFSLGTDASVNASGGTYVAYIYAHDAGGFGLSGTDNVISCGSFTTDGSGNATVSLGYEPQWVLFKRSTVVADNWRILDNMRGWSMTQDDFLFPNTSGVEVASSGWGNPTATGFTIGSGGATATYIYIAIRRGPMKVPTSGTSVFDVDTLTPAANLTGTKITNPFATDLLITTQRDHAGLPSTYAVDRLRGGSESQRTNDTSAEQSWGTPYSWKFDYNDGFLDNFAYPQGSVTTPMIYWSFRRAPGFFDEVCYTGNSAGANNQNHNLGVVPEMCILKARSGTFSADNWQVVHKNDGVTATSLVLDLTNGTIVTSVMSANFTSTYFKTADATWPFTRTNFNGDTYVAYLFATCAGVSKVGSYTGTGTTLQVNCGFTGGARFVLIKRTDSTGDWYVWDSARGIVAGNDPYLLLNSTAAEVTSTDYVDTYSAGFEISSTAPAAINASGGSFIFLAIA